MSLALMVDEPIPGHFYWMLLRQEKPGDSPTAFAHARGPLRTHRSAVEEGTAALRRYRDAPATIQ